MTRSGLTLVCFAVKEEAASFRGFSALRHVQICLTGIGQRNAEHALLSAIAKQTPDLVLTCGFAGALNPELTTGTVLFDTDRDAPLKSVLHEAGAQAGRFLCLERVAVTAKEKRQLWDRSGADAVEMESQVIRASCAKRRVPSATVRVILDTAHEDLPIDFNGVMDHNQQIHMASLLWRIARAPSRIPALLRFQKQCRGAAERLAEVLTRVLVTRAA